MLFEMRCCLNYIGVELENPFGRDDNDLPLKHFQVRSALQYISGQDLVKPEEVGGMSKF